MALVAFPAVCACIAAPGRRLLSCSDALFQRLVKLYLAWCRNRCTGLCGAHAAAPHPACTTPHLAAAPHCALLGAVGRRLLSCSWHLSPPAGKQTFVFTAVGGFSHRAGIGFPYPRPLFPIRPIASTQHALLLLLPPPPSCPPRHCCGRSPPNLLSCSGLLSLAPSCVPS